MIIAYINFGKIVFLVMLSKLVFILYPVLYDMGDGVT